MSALRQKFVEYFQKLGHEHIPSSPLVPFDDPTLLFTNAGMNQFKNVFLGKEMRSYRRAVSVQKCVRAGGKHNDLEMVGFTARHHTFFEMMGNFSFGDYFKQEAIEYAWKFLTEVLSLDPRRLYITVYEKDEETRLLWEKISGLGDDRIFNMSESDNFWRMGDTGPCGPCTEIYYDHGAHLSRYHSPHKEIQEGGDRIIEIWNLVFMQFDEVEPGKMIPLPRLSVDTGSGLERLQAVLEGTHHNYRTTLFQQILRKAAHLLNLDLQLLHSEEDQSGKTPKNLSALRVLADHIRAVSFLIADGVTPSQEGRGYIVRRIIRRALRYNYLLSSDRPIFHELLDPLIETMKEPYPELLEKKALIFETLCREQEKFIDLLAQGTELLEREFSSHSAKKVLSGETVFKLYDTYGFPVDLTTLIAREKGFELDWEGFSKAQQEAQHRSRQSWKGQIHRREWDQELSQWTLELKNRGLNSDFVGYQQLEVETSVLAYRRFGQDHFAFIPEKTPLYLEGGGQVSDHGEIKINGIVAPISDLQEWNGLPVHWIRWDGDSLPSKIFIKVVPQWRAQVAANHSATHLLHHALRKFVDPNISQAGSLVTPEKLRFDFSCSRPITREEIRAIEDWINEEIAAAIPSLETITTLEEAKKLGAMAFFQEKYGEKVRVMKIGSESLELCGGTHVSNTREILLFVIVSESGVSSGVRRIEALTHQRAWQYLSAHHRIHQALLTATNRSVRWEDWLSSSLPNPIEDVIEKLKEKVKHLEQEVKKLRSRPQTQWLWKDLVDGKVKLGLYFQEDAPRDQLLSLWDQVKGSGDWGVCILWSKGVTLVGSLDPQKISAKKVFQFLAQKTGGRGGGRDDLAQGALPQLSPERLTEELTEFLGSNGFEF